MKQVWKKVVSMILVLALVLSMGVMTTFAENDETVPLGIISAMSVELNALVEAAEIEKEETIAGNTFYVGTLNGVDVVLVKAGVGKVLAASCTETLIDTYHVGGIIFTGIAGGVGDDVSVMDMVIGTALVQHDYGTETNDGFVWNGKAAADPETGLIPVDEELSAIAYASACSVLGEEKVHQGIIATGDQFIASETYVAELQEKFNALACEMEGAAVARVADQFGVPCTVIRCMSDKADGIARDTYAFNYTEASNTSASVVMNMMETLSTALPFTDVADTDWYFDAVRAAYASGLMGGTSDTTFGPDVQTTRGQLVTILWRMAGQPEVETEVEIAFTDVTSGAYYEKAVCWAAAQEIVCGYDNGCFGADDLVTWEQLATILYRYANAMDADTTASTTLDELASAVADYAAESLAWALADGVVSTGENGMTSPKDAATRAQIAVTLVQFSEIAA